MSEFKVLPDPLKMPCTGVCFLGSLMLLIFAAELRANVRFDRQDMTVSAKLDQTEAHVDFNFTNDGKHPLVIGKITTSCGCTTAAADRKIYLPGESGTISATVQVGTAQGRLDKTIAIETNDADTPLVKLSIHVLVPQLVSFSPNPYLRWDQGGEPNSQTVSVTVEAPFPLKIIGVKSWHNKVHATLKEIEAGRKYEIMVTPTDTKEAINTAVELLTEAKWPGEAKKIWLLAHIKPKGEN